MFEAYLILGTSMASCVTPVVEYDQAGLAVSEATQETPQEVSNELIIWEHVCAI
jgi:hypothetical protein